MTRQSPVTDVESNLGMRERMLREALRIRQVEERIIELYPSDKIQSPVHLSIGQEAVAVGTCADLRRTDLLFGSYRSHAFYLAKGGDLKAMFAELYGKKTGCGGGKAGSMHLAAPDVGFMGSSAVVASTVPHAVGAALATKRLGKDQIIVSVYGDGATEEGVYHESLNMAALWELPVLFICENNGLAVHSKQSARQRYNLVAQAELYGIPATRITEGWDPSAVHDVVGREIRAVRQQGTPRFIEVETYRYREHVGPGEDHQHGYRAREDLERWMNKDPLVQDEALVAKYTPEIRLEIEEAVAFAEASPWPGASDLLTDVI